MTQNVQAKHAFPGDVPANLRCGFCGELVQGVFYRARNRFVCTSCAEQVNQLIERNTISPASFSAASVAGLVAALAGGAVWAVTVHITNWNIGYLAFVIGYAVGKAVHLASGKRRGPTLQWLAAILAGIGVIAGKLGIVAWEIVDALHANGEDVTPQRVLELIQDNAHSFASPFDLVWIGFAAFAAWRMCNAVNISIAGPFAYQPSNTPLQFDTVERLNEIPPATPPATPPGKP